MIAVLEKTTKTCSRCKEEKSIGEFYRNNQKKDNLRSECKECSKKHQQLEHSKLIHQKAKKKYRESEKGKLTERKQRDRYRKTIKGCLHFRFQDMIRRCNDLKNISYRWYGGRGVEVRFKSSGDFIDHVMNVLGFDTYDKIKDLNIDRIDTNGHYEPGNIRFVTPKINQNNRRNNI